ncbi:MAG TPA: AI-2E family transporter [Polyangiales bacterium]|nr:AI-2E family transporter [Polyangiales bacterium]
MSSNEATVEVTAPVTKDATTVLATESLPALPVRSRGQHMLTAAAVVVIIFGLRFAEAFLVPLTIGLTVAAISAPLVNWLSRRGAPTVVSATIVLLIDIAVLGGVGRLLLLAASDLQERLPTYIAKLAALSTTLEHYLSRHGLHKVADAAWISGEQAGAMIKTFAGDFASGASHLALVMFVVFFLLCELPVMGDKVRKLSGDADAQFERVDRIVRQVQLYLVVKLWTSMLVAVGAFIVLSIAGVQVALLLSLLLFLLHFIPNIGAVIAAVPAVAVAFMDRGPAAAVSVGVAYLVLNMVVGNLIEPRMLGSRLGMSPFVVLVGMLFWGWLWGPAGALLSVPILAATKIVLENIPDLAWMSELAELKVKVDERAATTPLSATRERVGFGLGATDRPRKSNVRETMPGFPVRRHNPPSPSTSREP